MKNPQENEEYGRQISYAFWASFDPKTGEYEESIIDGSGKVETIKINIYKDKSEDEESIL